MCLPVFKLNALISYFSIMKIAILFKIDSLFNKKF